MDDGMNGGERRQEIHAGAGLSLIEAARRAIVVSRPIAGHHALPVACRAEMPVRRHDHGHRVNRDRRAERRLSVRTTSVPAGSVNACLADTNCMIIHDRA